MKFLLVAIIASLSVYQISSAVPGLTGPLHAQCESKLIIHLKKYILNRDVLDNFQC